MTSPTVEIVAEVRERIVRYRGRSLNEQNTKATLIEPVLRALGWELEDLELLRGATRVNVLPSPPTGVSLRRLRVTILDLVTKSARP